MWNELVDKAFAFLRQTASNSYFLGSLVSALAPTRTQFHVDPAAACIALQHDLNLTNTTILSATYHYNASTVETLGTCWWQPTTNISVPLCRVQFIVNTSNISAITAEAWLPQEWYGRFLALGNGGLGGCIDYMNLEFATPLHFATVASDNGHDGDTASFFINNSEVLNDFTSRSIHVETVIGKQIVETYYGRTHRNSYYLGCSTGGRQGTYAALHYPEDFDGIVAGAPATDWNRLMGWKGMIARYLGAPNANSSASFIPQKLWNFIAKEVLNQCDGLDGIINGVITEPDACDFRPEAIQCVDGESSKANCLTKAQVETLRKIYEPLYGENGELLFPRYDPGAEAVPEGQDLVFSGKLYYNTEQWMKYVIYNNSDFDFNNYGIKDVVFADKVDPGGISTFSGDMSAFKTRGGKFLTYHGRRDELIPAGNSKRLYNLVSRTLGMPSIDPFYRLFLIPGLNHCVLGVGAVNIGQHGYAKPHVNASSHHVLLAIVDWVEKGVAPDTVTGIAADGVTERIHCRYPQRSEWNGTAFVCVA